MSGIFDDPLFDDPAEGGIPEPTVLNEGVIPGLSVQSVSGRPLGYGLTLDTAKRLAVARSAEIWGYGKTSNRTFGTDAHVPFKSYLLAYGRGGKLFKTREWPFD